MASMTGDNDIDDASNPLLLDSIDGSTNYKFSVKSTWEFWMYISDSPCGTSAIYQRLDNSTTITGARIVTHQSLASLQSVNSNDDECSVRTKSGRIDIQERNKTQSMSCTDKISKWFILGIQG
jgi:hypothetical protein